jgi:hypothetical protein
VIERFNFYDLYGYLVPGFALLGMLWLPLWWLAGRKIPGAWFAAVVAILLAYIAGHIVARFGQATLRYLVYNATSRRLQQVVPSNLLLSDEDDLLPPESRALLREGVSSYAEQFEGMYTMMRGLAAVSVVAAPYYAGWALADSAIVTAKFVDAVPYGAFLALLAIAVLTLFDRPRVIVLWSLWLVAVLSFPVGLYLGAVCVTSALPPDAISLLWVLSGAAAYFAARFYQGYRYFAGQFATTVYRDFYVLERLGPVQDRSAFASARHASSTSLE